MSQSVGEQGPVMVVAMAVVTHWLGWPGHPGPLCPVPWGGGRWRTFLLPGPPFLWLPHTQALPLWFAEPQFPHLRDVFYSRRDKEWLMEVSK